MTSQKKPFDFYAYRALKEIKEFCLYIESKTAVKRRASAEAKNLPLSSGYQSKNKKPRTDMEFSTKLTLCDEIWPTDNKEPYVKQLSKADMEEREMSYKIFSMKKYKPGEKKTEKQKGVSTKLELFLDPSIIRKKLTRSDLVHHSRVLLTKSLVEKHVLPLMEVNIVNEVEKAKGLTVTVYDQDTDSPHRLVFKKWNSSHCYILNGGWVQDFVNRRKLKEGDEIGMFWDQNSSRFNFCVLNRAPTIQ